MNKLKEWAGVATLAILVIMLGASYFGSGSDTLGAPIGVTRFTSRVDSAIGFSINGSSTIGFNSSGTQVSAAVINASSSLTIGGGTSVTKLFCNAVSRNVGTILTTATTTISMVLNGISTSSNQAFQFGVSNSSTLELNSALQLVSVYTSSTANNANVVIRNISSATYPAGTSTYSVCFTQF